MGTDRPHMHKKIKILAIASIGGHWIQLLRLKPLFERNETVYVSTNHSFGEMVDGKFYSVSDFNRNNLRGALNTIIDLFRIYKKEKPRVVITTGAAPGLVGLMIAKSMGIRTVWIDSVANVEELSLSGRIASKFCSRVYTQWPDLAKGRIVYAGNILS